MYAVGKLGSYISRGVVSVAAPFHPFGGAVDIVVVEQEDGSFKSSPWYVQFGKFQGVLKAREKVVIINVNGVDADFRMYLDSRGGAYFLKDADGEDGMSESVSWGGGISNLRRPKKIMSCNYDLERSKLVSEFDPGSAKFVTRSTSNGPRILEFVFEQESDNVNASKQVDAIRSEREREREGSLERAEIAADLLEVRWSTSLATRKQRKEYPSSPHSNGFHDKSSRLVHVIDEVDTDIPAPVNFMESFSLEEKHFEVGGLSSGDEHSNAFQILQGDDGSKIKIDRSGVDNASNLREMTSEVKPELSSGILTCEVDKNIEKLEGEDPLVTDDGSKSIAVLETKVEVILDCKNGEGPVKYVEETVVDQVSASQEPSLTNAFLIEDATVAALNLMENLRSEKRCSSPLPDLVRLGSCENHDSLVASGPASEYSEGEQLLSSDLESLERKLALTTNFTSKQHDSDDCGESTPEISTTSSPISIARARAQVDQISHTVDPLSSSWSHGVELNPQDVDHPIRRSLDSSFDNMMLVQGDVPTISENVTQEQKTTPRKSSLEQHQLSKEFQEVLSDPAVEISLSGPLVHKGMGYEAAASAFDAEKVDAKTFISLCPDVIKNNEVVVRIGGLYFPWDAALPIISAIGAPRGEQILEPKGMILVDQVENDVKTGPQQSIDSSEGTWRLWPFKKTKTMSRNSSSVSDSTGSQRGLAGNTDTIKSEIVKKNVVRAKTPTSEQLESLNLKEGKNVVTFTFSTPMLGEQKVDAQIYLWKWNARIVISDVDGTITKSDVLGQFMPMVGVDWSQTGVTHLFSAIKENGYELLFLSARAISQASLTRQFLFNLKQDGKALPQGPVVISPDGLFPSLFREVIRRAPHEFKIACLEDIKALFPLDHNPFYAGFGNRDTDEISYVKVGIPIGKVFIINPKGEVAVHRRVDTKSYTSLHDLVNEMFPHPISVPPNEKEDYNNWNFWRLPPPDIR